MLLSSTPSPSVLREPVSRMQLLFDEEDDEGQEREGNAERSTDPQGVVDNSVSSSRSLKKPAAPQDPGWGAGGDAHSSHIRGSPRVTLERNCFCRVQLHFSLVIIWDSKSWLCDLKPAKPWQQKLYKKISQGTAGQSCTKSFNADSLVSQPYSCSCVTLLALHQHRTLMGTFRH